MDIRLFLVLAVVVVASAVFREEGSVPDPEVFIRIDPQNDFEWIKFKQTYNKTYRNPREEAFRRRIWGQNVEFVNRHNEEFLLGDHSFWVGIQSHSDLSRTEVKATMTGLIPPQEGEEVYPPGLTEPDLSLPSGVDWRNSGYVTGVRNQGSCGSCWAFSAVGALEGQHKRKKGSLPSLSEQNLVDCSRDKYSNYGCQGGWMNRAFNYIKDNAGIDTRSCYPYTARQGSCNYRSSCKGSYDNGYQTIGRSEYSLQDAVANKGPQSIAVDVTSTQFDHYRGGVYDYPSCSQWSPGHGMLVIGYGTQSGKDYWLVKNSWGTGWGESGYVKMRRNSNNQCGIANYASYPLL